MFCLIKTSFKISKLHTFLFNKITWLLCYSDKMCQQWNKSHCCSNYFTRKLYLKSCDIKFDTINSIGGDRLSMWSMHKIVTIVVHGDDDESSLQVDRYVISMLYPSDISRWSTVQLWEGKPNWIFLFPVFLATDIFVF